MVQNSLQDAGVSSTRSVLPSLPCGPSVDLTVSSSLFSPGWGLAHAVSPGYLSFHGGHTVAFPLVPLIVASSFLKEYSIRIGALMEANLKEYSIRIGALMEADPWADRQEAV